MKGVKCILLLALSTMLGLSFVVYSDVSALQHEYRGMPLTSPFLPFPSQNSNNDYYLDFSQSASNSNSWSVVMPFTIQFKGDASTDLNNLNVLYSSSYFNPDFIDNSCSYNGGSILPTFSFDSDSVSASIPSFYPKLWSSFSGNSKCRRLDKFGSGSVPQFDSSSLPSGILSCNKSNGAVCGGLWNSSEYLDSEVLPYWFSHSGFIFQSHAIDSDTGIHYNSSFSLSDLFGQTISRFSYLQVPLWDNDSDFFWTSSNFYEGRHLEFKAAFEFDGSFDWHSNINNNGSFFRIHASTVSAHSGFDNSEIYFDCTANYITVENLKRLEFSCPVDLSDDYLAFFPLLEISGNDNYVFQTDDNWRFAFTYLITDYDTTPGQDFNSDIIGGGSKFFGDANNNISSADPDWFSSLTGLFNFNFLNPFVPLFSLFTSQDSCAQIPIIAGMLHSESSTVCPFFDSNIRSILTPVLGISGMMLVFGFAVKWLGAQSGNFFEDSGGISAPTSVPTGSSGVKRLGWRRK